MGVEEEEEELETGLHSVGSSGVRTPLRLACAGHKRDQTKEILRWEGLGDGGGLRPVRLHTGARLRRLLCVNNDGDRAERRLSSAT